MNMVARPFPELESADNSRSASPALDAGRAKAKAKGRGKKPVAKSDVKADVKADVAKPAPNDNATAGRRKHKPRKPNAGSTPQTGSATEAKAGTASKAKAEAKTESSEAKTEANPETKRSSGSRRKNRRRPKKTQPQPSPESSRASSAMSGSVASTTPLSQPRMPKSLSTGMLSTATIVAGANGCARVQLGRMDEYQPLPGMGGGPRFVASHVVQQRRSSTGHFGMYGDMGLVTPTDMGPRQRSLTSTPQRAGFAPHSAGYSPQTAGYTPHSAGYTPHSAGYTPHSAGYAQNTGYSPLSAGYIPHSADGMRGRSFSASHQLNTNMRAPPVQPQGYFASRRASVSSGLAVDPDHSIRIPTIMFQRSSSSPLVSQPDGESVAMRRLQDMIASVRAAGKPEQSVPTPSHPSARFDSILEEDEDSDEQDVELNRPQSSLCA